MVTDRGPFAWLGRFLAGIGVCGISGVIVGLVTGFALTLLDLADGPLQLSNVDVLVMWLTLAVFGWLMLIFVFAAFVRWSVGSVAMPALVNSALVTGLTVLICWLAGLFAVAWLVGLLVGLAIGYLLCSLYRQVTRA